MGQSYNNRPAEYNLVLGLRDHSLGELDMTAGFHHGSGQLDAMQPHIPGQLGALSSQILKQSFVLKKKKLILYTLLAVVNIRMTSQIHSENPLLRTKLSNVKL